MKHLFILLLAALSVTACNHTGNAGSETLTVDELLATADALVGDTVRVEGLCVSTCGHGSTHITLMGSDTTQMVEALADEHMQSFDPMSRASWQSSVSNCRSSTTGRCVSTPASRAARAIPKP